MDGHSVFSDIYLANLSLHLESRCVDLQTGNPSNLEVIKTIQLPGSLGSLSSENFVRTLLKASFIGNTVVFVVCTTT